MYTTRLYSHRQRLAREMLLWQGVRHPNVTPFLGFMRSINSIVPGCPFVLTPYYERGNINAYLEKNPNANVLALVSPTAGVSINDLYLYLAAPSCPRP